MQKSPIKMIKITFQKYATKILSNLNNSLSKIISLNRPGKCRHDLIV